MTTTNIEILTRPFPREAVKQRAIGGGLKADYVDGQTVIRRLNEATGNCWSFTVDRYWSEGDLGYALVTLSLPDLGSRQHIGVQRINERSGEDAVAKGSITDGLKKAATLFGVAIELYGPDYESGEIVDAPIQRNVSFNQLKEAPRANVPPTQAPQPVVSGQLATDKQVKFIWALAGERGLVENDVYADTFARYGKTHLHDLTRQEASIMIEELQARRGPDPVTVHPASQAATGMDVGAESYWIRRINEQVTEDDVLDVHDAAFQRFGLLSRNFLDTCESRILSIKAGSA